MQNLRAGFSASDLVYTAQTDPCTSLWNCPEEDPKIVQGVW